MRKHLNAQSKNNLINDSYLARIGGGGLTAKHFDIGEKQSDLLKTIAENSRKKLMR